MLERATNFAHKITGTNPETHARKVSIHKSNAIWQEELEGIPTIITLNNESYREAIKGTAAAGVMAITGIGGFLGVLGAEASDLPKTAAGIALLVISGLSARTVVRSEESASAIYQANDELQAELTSPIN